MSDVTTGTSTSEFKLVSAAQILGILGAVIPPVWVAVSSIATSFPNVRWIAAVVSVLSILWTVLASLGYAKQRTELKKAALTAGKALAVLALLVGLTAGVARAEGFGVQCFSGCPSDRLKADTQLTSTVWIGPGLGAAPTVYNFSTKEWRVALSPVIAYGLWWRPPAWTATKSLLGVNFSLSGEVVGVPQAHLDPLLTINVLDNIQLGGGIRVNFASPNLPGGIDPTFAVYWTTSVGGP